MNQCKCGEKVAVSGPRMGRDQAHATACDHDDPWRPGPGPQEGQASTTTDEDEAEELVDAGDRCQARCRFQNVEGRGRATRRRKEMRSVM